MFDDKITKAMIEVGKNAAEDIVRPSSKSIGDNLGLLVDGVMGWLGYWGQKQEIKRKIYLEDYKRKISEKVAGIPEEKLQEPEIRIVGPAIEASKYYIEEEDFRELFAKLISASCNRETARSVHPAFTEIIKQLSPQDAKFIHYLHDVQTIPAVEIYARDQNNVLTPCPYLLMSFDKKSSDFSIPEEIELTKTIDNLSRLGLLLKNREVIELKFNYENFRDHWFYKAYAQTIEKDSKIEMRRYRIELTVLGMDFAKCCM